MKKFFTTVAAIAMLAGPAAAVDVGLATGNGTTSSVSQAGAQSSGAASSALIGATQQQSTAGAQSQGFGSLVFTNNNMFANSGQTSQTAQQGTSASLGLAQSANLNQAIAQGQSGAVGNINAGWIFVGP